VNDLDPFLREAVPPAGWQVVYEPVVGSTNDLARQAAERGWPGRSVFVADEQRAGRGRQGRQWLAPPGFGLLFSLLLRPGQERLPPLHYTMLASVSLAEVLEQLGLQPAIKWPNDLLLDDRKVAGILAESFLAAGAPALVVGCGVNVGLSHDLPVGLPPTATTLFASAGRRIHRGDLLLRILQRLDAWLAEPPARLRRAWHARLWHKHQVIRAVEGGQELVGTIEAVADDGTLTLRLLDGTTRRLVSGELLL